MVKKEGLVKNQLREMTITKFLKEYHYEDWYLSNIAPAEMMKDLVVNPLLRIIFFFVLDCKQILQKKVPFDDSTPS